MADDAPPLPRRSSRFGVGKEIGGAVYVHRRYEAQLGAAVEEARRRLPADFSYTLVKFNPRSGAVSFIVCDDFDAACEPAVGEILTVDRGGNLRRRPPPPDPEIYHHKWLFVADDYDGFDVAESKRRSRLWTSLSDVDRRRIGRRSYWQQHVVPRLTGK